MWSRAANGKFSQIIQKNMADTKNDGRKKGLIRPMCLKALKNPLRDCIEFVTTINSANFSYYVN